MSDIVIRAPAPSDRMEWAALWAQYNAFYGREKSKSLDETIVETTWRRLLDVEEQVYGLVAERSGALVGLAHFIFHRNTIQLADTCYLQDLFTGEASRGHGVGAGLVDAMAKVCRERGVNDIYWHTHQGNQIARSLYDRIARDTEFVVYRMDIAP